MTKDLICVQYPTVDVTQSVAVADITKTNVNVNNGISVKNAFANKNNSLIVCFENGDSDSYVTFCAGDAYPNALLGDLNVPVLASTTTAIQIQDISRFENKDGSLNIDFGSDFSGSVYAIAKSVALNV